MKSRISSIAYEFQKFLDGRSYGFSGNMRSIDEKIVRYKEGIQKITELTGISKEELESDRKIEIDSDNNLVDVRFYFEKIVFEYTFPYDHFDEMIDEENGWWKIFYAADEDAPFEDISVLYFKEDGEE